MLLLESRTADVVAGAAVPDEQFVVLRATNRCKKLAVVAKCQAYYSVVVLT